MKKFAITSICTLVLSLLGAFGLNQNSLNSNANSISTGSVENIQDIENNQSLPGDNQTNAAELNSPAAEATDNNEVNTEKIRENVQDNNTATATQNQNTNSNIAVSDNNTQNTDSNLQVADKEIQNTDNMLQTVNNTDTQVKSESQAKVQSTPIINVSNQTGNKNGQVYFGKINLSNCKSTSDVVKVLNNNGYKDITLNNIKNIKSLEDILAYVNNNSSVNTPAPTKAPAPTTAPAPTKAPAPTTKPVPTVKPAPTTAPSNTGISSYASEVLRLVNIERSKAGLSALTTNSTLTAAANKRAQETKQSFSHTRPNGTSAFTVLGEYGISYRAAGENIAYGQRTPQEVVTGWMNSPGHRANILNSNFGKIGIGVYQSNGVIYWSQLFTD
jgi:uncharacterized protein YkwD